MMGAFLAEMVHGREHPSARARALKRRGWNWPPEPLRWAVCQLLTAGLRAGDTMVDRQIRRLRGAGAGHTVGSRCRRPCRLGHRVTSLGAGTPGAAFLAALLS